MKYKTEKKTAAMEAQGGGQFCLLPGTAWTWPSLASWPARGEGDREGDNGGEKEEESR